MDGDDSLCMFIYVYCISQILMQHINGIINRQTNTGADGLTDVA